jgi:4-hydroxy 2-oxovalerate aldolase
MKLIDCTFRDGGHLNNWKFDPMQVRRSYVATCNAGVDFFEVGYRQFSSEKDYGPFAFCDDDYIFTLLDQGSTKPIVMVDASKMDISLFRHRKDSPFYGVRVAAYPYEIDKAVGQVEDLLELGYHVWLNPMATTYLEDKHLEFLANWKYKDMIEALYLADSFGSFTPQTTKTFIQRFKDYGFVKLGFHAHNNLQLAVANTLEAVNNGVDFIDATIYGMGRGAGNAPIEIIASLILGYKASPYLELIKQYFQEYPTWGAKPDYVCSGRVGVHPYYTDALSRQLTFDEMTEFFKNHSLPISYNEKRLMEALEEYRPCK